MGNHFKVRGTAAQMRKVAPEWLKLNSEISQLVNTLSMRRDLVAYIGKDGGQGMAAALYSPDASEVELNTTIAFGEHVLPGAVGDFRDRDTHYEWPVATGALLHEAMHAQHSTDKMIYDGAALFEKPSEYHWYTILDEPRIEAQGVKQHPDMRAFLRASSLKIVLGDFDGKFEHPKPTFAAAHLAILTLGRVDAGVLEPKDVAKARTAILTVIPKPVLKQMEEIWKEFILLRGDHSIPRMAELSRDFDKLVQEQMGQSGENSQDPDDQADAEALQDFLDAMGKAINADRVSAERGANEDLERQQTKERKQAEQEQRQKQDVDHAKNQHAGESMFGKKGEDRSNLAGMERSTGSRSRLASTREPTPEERIMSAKLARALEKAKYRDRLVTVQNRAVPPGKLRVGTAMQLSASRAVSHTPVSAEPWRKKTRKHVEDPNLTLGIMCDISGSMARAMEPIGVSAWALSNAGHKIKAQVAAVYYGLAAFPVLRPGERLKQVQIYTAPDSGHEFDAAFRALDGGLELLRGRGARLLVICSDGHYGGGEETQAVKKWLAACAASGVAVIWLDYTNSAQAQDFCSDSGATYVAVAGSATAATDAIGAACTEALTKASH